MIAYKKKGCIAISNFLIQGATIVDGSGAAPFRGDILVRGDKIIAVGGKLPSDDSVILEAQGLTVAPGLIDGHSHNELQIMENPQHSSAITQGITTEVVGQCGLGFAPLSDKNLEEMIRLYSGIVGAYEMSTHNWNSFEEFLSRLDGAALNVACPVSHSAIRANAMGFVSGAADSAALAKMQADTDTAMSQGAVGFSTGLTYYPAGYSRTEELIAICDIVKKHDGIFLVHKRDNYREPRDMGDAEIVRIMRETGVRTHLLHYKTSLSNAGNIDELLAPYKAVLDEGLDLSFELYPYYTGAGYGVVFLPPWVMDGGYNTALQRLSAPSLRDRIEADIQWRCKYILGEEGATFTVLKHTPQYEGKTLAEVCIQRNQTLVPMLLDLLVENELEMGYHANALSESESTSTLEADFFRLLELPNYTVGSDSIVYGSHLHPRASGSFTKLLRLSREKQYPLEKLIYKMTAYTASRYRLLGKGKISPGMDADLCMFDYETVSDRATYSTPRRLSLGMKYVLVNGRLALENGCPTGTMSGKALRHKI